jgi:hypothetical protein
MPLAASASPQSSAAYTLSISDEGRAMAEKAGTDGYGRVKNVSDQKAGAVPDNELPLEAFSVPPWLGDYLPDALVVTPELDYGFWNMVGGLTQDNHLSSEDRLQIGSYLRNSPKHQAVLAKDEFTRQFKEEISEYTNSLRTYSREALEENGVTSPADYYKKVVLDQENSEKIHQSMRERIESSPRMIELMEILGINP